jgi:hypothetical protein
MSDYAASRVSVGCRWGWSHLLAILALAALVRLMFFASALGTDELDPGDLGLGHSVLAALRGVASLMPATAAGAVTRATDPLWQVAPAKVYAVTGKCAREAQL